MTYDPGPTSDDVLLQTKGEGESIEVSVHFHGPKGLPGQVIASWRGSDAVTRLMADAIIYHRPAGGKANDESLREAALAYAKVHAPAAILEFRARMASAFERAAEGLGDRYAQLEAGDPVERETETDLPEDEEDRQERLFLKVVREAVNGQDEFLGQAESRLDIIEAHLLDLLEDQLLAGHSPGPRS